MFIHGAECGFRNTGCGIGFLSDAIRRDFGYCLRRPNPGGLVDDMGADRTTTRDQSPPKTKEQRMSSTIRAVLALSFIGFIGACAGPVSEEVVYVDEPMVSVEPVYTGKYK